MAGYGLMPLNQVVPVVLCGGAGRRLRPLSRPTCPKPFLKLGSPFSMLQETLLRVRECAAPVLVMNRMLRDRAQDNFDGIDMVPHWVIFLSRGGVIRPLRLRLRCWAMI